MTTDIATQRDIARACAYIADDGAVAAYFGIDRALVAEVRKTHRVAPPRAAHSGQERYSHNDEHPSSGINKQLDDRTSAECASIQMLDRIIKLVECEAKKLRIAPAAALWLLQDRPSLAQIAERASVKPHNFTSMKRFACEAAPPDGINLSMGNVSNSTVRQ